MLAAFVAVGQVGASETLTLKDDDIVWFGWLGQGPTGPFVNAW